jgi:hypothetical protein
MKLFASVAAIRLSYTVSESRTRFALAVGLKRFRQYSGRIKSATPGTGYLPQIWFHQLQKTASCSCQVSAVAVI